MPRRRYSGGLAGEARLKTSIDRTGIEGRADVQLLKPEVRMTREMDEVVGVARGQVIDAKD